MDNSPVTVYRFIAAGTIKEKIIHLLREGVDAIV